MTPSQIDTLLGVLVRIAVALEKTQINTYDLRYQGKRQKARICADRDKADKENIDWKSAYLSELEDNKRLYDELDSERAGKHPLYVTPGKAARWSLAFWRRA